MIYRLKSVTMSILDESQISQLLVAARGSRMLALLHLAISTGMRQMEILGLKWNNLDWVKKTLKVEHQLVRGEGVQFAQPKTRYGRRIDKESNPHIYAKQKKNPYI